MGPLKNLKYRLDSCCSYVHHRKLGKYSGPYSSGRWTGTLRSLPLLLLSASRESTVDVLLLLASTRSLTASAARSFLDFAIFGDLRAGSFAVFVRFRLAIGFFSGKAASEPKKRFARKGAKKTWLGLLSLQTIVSIRFSSARLLLVLFLCLFIFLVLFFLISSLLSSGSSSECSSASSWLSSLTSPRISSEISQTPQG